MAGQFTKKIVFEDGSEFYGYGFGADCERVCEIVFNTGVVGYQEIVSDPTYAYQAVVMTYPLIGNYGIADDDFEGKVPLLGALVVREYNDIPSNFRYTKTLAEILEENNIPGISGVDTRMITRKIRDFGSVKVILANADTPAAEAVEKIKNTHLPKDMVARVSSKKRWYKRTPHPKYNVVAIDCGIKLSVIRSLKSRGCNITVVPYNTSADEILSLAPDGVLISNGPGNPEDVSEICDTIKALCGKLPMFGIGLGYQLICLAYGAKTVKLKCGCGGGHPVRNLKNGKIEMTSQNHCYTVDEASLGNTKLEITHRNVLNNSVEGVACNADKLFGVQYRPESAPGPQDSAYLFDEFTAMMEKEVSSNA